MGQTLRTTTRDGEPSEVQNLADLILAVKTDKGWTYAQLEEKSGAVLTRQRWQQLGTGIRIKEFPEPATLKAMADALNVEVTTVVLAAAKTIGLPVRRDLTHLAALLPAGTERLTDQQRDAILAVVKAMLPPAQIASNSDAEDTSNEKNSPTSSRRRGVPDSGRTPIVPSNVTPIGRGHSRDGEQSELLGEDVAADTADEGVSESDGFYPDDPDPYNLQE